MFCFLFVSHVSHLLPAGIIVISRLSWSQWIRMICPVCRWQCCLSAVTPCDHWVNYSCWCCLNWPFFPLRVAGIGSSWHFRYRSSGKWFNFEPKSFCMRFNLVWRMCRHIDDRCLDCVWYFTSCWICLTALATSPSLVIGQCTFSNLPNIVFYCIVFYSVPTGPKTQ